MTCPLGLTYYGASHAPTCTQVKAGLGMAAAPPVKVFDILYMDIYYMIYNVQYTIYIYMTIMNYQNFFLIFTYTN